MHVSLLTFVGALVGAACSAALLTLLTPRLRHRERTPLLRPELALALVGQDDGLMVLRLRSAQDRWWDEAAEAEMDRVDRALSAYDLLAWYVSRGVVDRRVAIEACRDRIIELWEQAYPYVLDRRRTTPELWSFLAELYVDAHTAPVAGRRGAARLPAAVGRPHRDQRSVSPDDTSVAEPVPAPAVPPAVPIPPVPFFPSASSDGIEAAAPQPVHTPSLTDYDDPAWAEALRRALSSAAAEGAAPVRWVASDQPRVASFDQVVDLDSPSPVSPPSAPVASAEPAPEHVIDLVFEPGTAGAPHSGGLHSR